MKKNLLLSIFTVLSVAAAITYSSVRAYPYGQCPAMDPLDHTVMLPSAISCEEFYICSRGVPILQRCPIGLHWNDRRKTCDWPQTAGCIDDTSDDDGGGEDKIEYKLTVCLCTNISPKNGYYNPANFKNHCHEGVGNSCEGKVYNCPYTWYCDL